MIRLDGSRGKDGPKDEGRNGEPWLLPLGIDEQRKTCLERGEEEE